MKNLILAMLTVPLFANAQVAEKGILDEFFENWGKTHAEIEREKRQRYDDELNAVRGPILTAAEQGIEDGLTPQTACDRAVAQITFTAHQSANLSMISRRCEHDVRHIYHQQVERDRAERRADEGRKEYAAKRAAKQAEIERRQQDELAKKAVVAEIRAGKRQILTFEEAVAAYEAGEGFNLASAPKIRPDGRPYYLAGTIERADQTTASFTALANNGLANMMQRAIMGIHEGDRKYFHVRLPKSMEAKYYEMAKLGIGFDLVGRYASNVEYLTIAGERKSMPVFEALYFEFWTADKLK